MIQELKRTWLIERSKNESTTPSATRKGTARSLTPRLCSGTLFDSPTSLLDLAEMSSPSSLLKQPKTTSRRFIIESTGNCALSTPNRAGATIYPSAWELFPMTQPNIPTLSSSYPKRTHSCTDRSKARRTRAYSFHPLGRH